MTSPSGSRDPLAALFVPALSCPHTVTNQVLPLINTRVSLSTTEQVQSQILAGARGGNLKLEQPAAENMQFQDADFGPGVVTSKPTSEGDTMRMMFWKGENVSIQYFP